MCKSKVPVKNLFNEIAKEDEEKHKKHVTHPLRLGKHRFEPAPAQVLLLSEESTDSFQNLKGCCTTTDQLGSVGSARWSRLYGSKSVSTLGRHILQVMLVLWSV
ncbi:hypothetical protein M5689_002258 [Euphorbia peplus]|nr:hypothetical protein M5689_002258 [Euphorbia peplus]